jgi:hypothetical protein
MRKLTIKGLLNYRFKRIAGWPGMPDSDIGTIIHNPPVGLRLNCYKKYPHLFKELKWCEERDMEQLKAVVKYLRAGDKVLRVDSWYHSKAMCFDDVSGIGGTYTFRHLLPATEEEYKKYLKKNEQQ